MKSTPKHAQKKLSVKIADTLTSYLKTQFILIAVVTVISWCLLSFLGVSYALLLSLITGSFSIIPVLGILTAALLTALVAVFDSSRFLPNAPVVLEGLVIILLYILLNILIDYFLSPYLIGKTMKIHPLILIVSVLIGTSVFGIAGTILTVPVLLVAKTVSDHYKGKLGTVVK